MKVDNVKTDAWYKQRDWNSKRKSKENAEIKNTAAEVKNAFDGFNSRLDRAKEKINEFEDKWIETSQTEMQREERMNKME